MISGGSDELPARRRAVSRAATDLMTSTSDRPPDAGSSRPESRPLEAQLAASAHRIRVLEAHVEELQRRYERLERRASVRMALRAAALVAPIARPVVRVARRLARPLRRDRRRASRARSAPAERDRPRRTEAEVVEGLRALRPVAGPTSGPLVSIVVLTRNGAGHMERLLTGLRDRTVYRSFEVVVVDNASTDHTSDVLGRAWGFPVRVLRNTENATFSAGNNQGLAAAAGDMILLANNDVAPINDGWLGAMVGALEAAPRFSGVGALLVYPDGSRRGTGRADARLEDLSVQHRGIGFTWRDGVPRGVNLGGDDPLEVALVETSPVPAATAACFLVRAEDLRAVGGLSEGYVYGTEDVDLCLKLRAAGGEIVTCGGAALFHHESATQKDVAREQTRANRLGNARLFAERWAPALSRSLRLDQLSGEGRWTGRRSRTLVITVTRNDPSAGFGDYYTAHELGDAMQAMGWQVRYAELDREGRAEIGGDVDLVVALLDRFDVRCAPDAAHTVAWVRSWVDRWISRPWFENYDLVVASSAPAAELIRARTRHAPAVMPLAANPERFQPLSRNPELESDYTFTGNNWGRGRSLMDWIQVRPGERFHLYGRGWDRVRRALPYRRGHLPYARLPEVYASTSIVVDDTAEHTLPYGAVNSRVFEALACGALVITNNSAGSEELFDGLLPTYSSPAELRAQLDRYLSDDELRRSTAAELRRIVLERHTYAHRAAELLAACIEEVKRPVVALKIGPPSKEVMERWGDTHFARSFARSLRALGFATRVHILPEWDALSAQRTDVVCHLRGLSTYVPKPAPVNVQWIISHPDEVRPAECEMYDLVFVASEPFARDLRERVSVPVRPLLQATDVERFKPVPPDDRLRCDVLFVGNSRGKRRPVVDGAIEAGARLHVYGSAWDGIIPKLYVRATYFPNERLPELYRSAGIVLNDHWPDMRAHGFISNRVFDVLACEAFLVSDDVAGLAELVGEAVPTFRTAEDLARLIKRFAADTGERERLARAGARVVRESHSFDARAAEFVAAIAPLLRDRPSTVEEMADARSLARR